MAFVGIANAQSHHWTPMTGNQYTMIVNGVVTIDGVVQTANTLEIGAFCGEQCRESVFIDLFSLTGDYIAMMNIRSNAANNETITFRLYDHAAGEELDLECETSLAYVADAVISNPNDWFEFAFSTPGIHTIEPGNWNDPDTWGGEAPTTTSSAAASAG